LKAIELPTRKQYLNYNSAMLQAFKTPEKRLYNEDYGAHLSYGDLRNLSTYHVSTRMSMYWLKIQTI
jgi:hypothetical protein